MRVTPIYTNTLNDLRTGVRTVIHQGGQWSGKTVGILQALATCCNEEEADGTELATTTVTSMSMPHLKGGALSDFENFVYPDFKSAIKKYHRTDHVFTFRSGSKIEFKAFENEMTARGAKRRRLFINEANSFSPMVFFQLNSRSEQTILDYNPSVRFWVHDDLVGQPGNKFYRSWHHHNPFLKASKHAEIEGQKDKELWKVYARGITGNVSGVIFPDWTMIDNSDFRDDENDCIFSIDFGYTVDPTAIVKCYKIGNSLFIKELAYETGLSDHSILNILRANGYHTDLPLYCERDPDMIRELRNVGIPYALPARKGQGSVNAGIEQLRKMNVFYTCSSQNLHRERSRYVWMTDKHTGKFVNIPVDNNNHCFDAIRYGVYTRYLQAAA